MCIRDRPLTDYLVDARVNAYSVSMTGTVSKAAVEYIISGADKDSVARYADKALALLSLSLIHISRRSATRRVGNSIVTLSKCLISRTRSRR